MTWCDVNIFGTTSSTGALANMKFESYCSVIYSFYQQALMPYAFNGLCPSEKSWFIYW